MKIWLAILLLASANAVAGEWAEVSAEKAGLDLRLLEQARDYALTGGGSGFITRNGKLVLQWGDPKKRYDLKSTTKSIGVTALGLALADGKVKLADKAADHHPDFGAKPGSNQKSGWLPKITLQHLATQTAGFRKPGGYTELLFEPGTKWDYSDSGPNWLAECLTLAYRRDMRELLFERVFAPLGILPSDLSWRANAYRPRQIEGIERREFGSGISANVDAMARIGLLYLRQGEWQGRQLIARDFVRMASQPVDGVVGLSEHGERFDNASDHYGLLWWNNADGTLTNVPTDAFWSWGLHDSLIVVMPSLGIVAARAGRGWKRANGGHYDVLEPFLSPIAAAARPKTADFRIEWAPPSTIVRKARGSDNWPLTWGDDGALYGAYGDGRGFQPLVPKKLSLGLVGITGGPDDFVGTNLHAPSIEQYGGGSSGGKASGMLMAGGTLYMWVRNRKNSQLAWSEDRGKSWRWADWKFTTSFGAPTFLNFGANYAGAIDDFVYVYSFDSDKAYKPAADRMVLARVPRKMIRNREAYAFFVERGGEGAVWSPDIARRGAVFEDRGECYRSGVSYNAGLGQFVWAQIKGANSGSTRFKGGLAVYFADAPWGPWREIFRAKTWDTGPGESASFPPKWMSEDGREMHLVFSGEDAFSVRKATVFGQR